MSWWAEARLGKTKLAVARRIQRQREYLSEKENA